MPALRCLAALVCGAMVAAATPAAQQAPAAQQLVFRSGVDVVRLDVRVLDDRGRPIPDIRADEVTVVEGGVERPVLLFQYIEQAGRTYLESAERTIAADVSTNQGAPRGQLYVLLFDQEHITPGREQRVRRAAETFIRERVTPRDRVAVFGLPGPGPAQPFTANKALAVEALQHVRGDLQRVPTGGEFDMRVHEAYEILRGNDQVLSRFFITTEGGLNRTGVIPDAPVRRVQTDPTATQLLIREHAQQVTAGADASARRFLSYATDLLRSFQGIDGRKTIVLFSEGFHGDNVMLDLTRLAGAAAETYSVIYAFDLNQRTENLESSPIASADAGPEIQSRLEPLGGLALETNGDFVINAVNRLDAALATLAEAETSYYVLGFEPSEAALADRQEYRRVTVRVRRPGAHVSVRTGYTAGPAISPADRRRAIDTALAAPFAHQGLRLEYTTYVSRAEHAGLQDVAVSLEADLPVATNRHRVADVVFVVRNATTGEVVASGTDTMALPERPAAGTALGTSSWQVRFELPSGRYLMRCVVREPGGLIGSADRHFVVRRLAGGSVATSDLVLGTPGGSLPVRAAAYSSEWLGGSVRVYGRDPAQLSAVTADLDVTSLGRDASPSRRITGTAGEVRAVPGGAQRDVTFSIPLDGLEAGEYVARAVVRAAGETVAELRRQFDVILGSRPVSDPAATRRTGPQPRGVLDGVIAERLIKAAAASPDALVRRAAAEAAQSRWHDAMATLAAAPTADSDGARLRSLARLDTEDYATAELELGAEFDRRPTDAVVAFVLGWARVGSGNLTGAVSAFRSAAWLEPALVPAHLALAETCLALGQKALAIQALESGLRQVPDSPELREMLGRLR